MANTDVKTNNSYVIKTLNDELEDASRRLEKELKKLHSEYDNSDIPSDIRRKYLRRIKKENTLGTKDIELFTEVLDWAMLSNLIRKETAVNIVNIIERPALYRKAEVQMKVTLKNIYFRLLDEYTRQYQ